MRINEVICEEESFNLSKAISQHEASLRRQKIDNNKINFIINHIRSYKPGSQNEFQAAAQEAQDRYNAKMQAKRDSGQDEKIASRNTDKRADGREKQPNQYTGPRKPKAGSVGGVPVPGEIQKGSDIGNKAAKSFIQGLTSK